MRAAISADDKNEQPVRCGLYVQVYGPDNKVVLQRGPQIELKPGATHDFSWKLEDTGGSPIAEIGLEIRSELHASGTAYLDYLTWDGPPNITFKRPDHNGQMWRRAWVNGVDVYGERNHAHLEQLAQQYG